MALFSTLTSLESLPESMKEAVIVLIPNPGKDLKECASYRPVSLLNVDAKTFAKLLAGCLSTVIEDLIWGLCQAREPKSIYDISF